MASYFKDVYELCDMISIVVSCPSDSTILLVTEQNCTEHWLPSIKVVPGLTWTLIDDVMQEIFGIALVMNRFLTLSKVWLPAHSVNYLNHAVFEILVSPETKKKTKFAQGKYKGKTRWVDENELNLLYTSNIIRSPELLQIFDFAFGIPPVSLSTTGTSYTLIGNFLEINEDIIVVSKANANELLVHACGMDRHVQEVLYRDFIMRCFPAVFMSLEVFTRTMLSLGWDKDEIPHLFRCADFQNRHGLAFREFLYYLAVTEPGTNHAGPLAELRCRYIFRYLDVNKKNFLKKEELRRLYAFTRKAKNLPADVDKVDKELSEVFKLMKFPETHAITMAQFLTNVGELKIRGTSQICRSPTNIRKFFIECLKQENKKLLGKKDENADTSSDYNVAAHCVTLKTTAKLNIDEVTTFTYAVSAGTIRMQFFPETMRQQSYDKFNLKSLPNEILKQVKQLVKANKIPMYSKVDQIKYNWLNIDPRIFSNNLKEICGRVKEILKKEPRLLDITSPVYVMGDFHGNITDLLNFETALWPLGYNICPCNLLFLGDYVDRGMFSLEVIAYLFSLKLLIPNKVHLIRGNHEIKRIQQLWTFETECNKKLGEKSGPPIFEAINDAFDALPLAAVIDQQVFCCHGGIPPPWLCPTAIAINDIPVPLANPQKQSGLAWELMWNDPVRLNTLSENMLMELMANEGFAVNTQRETAHSFSSEALEKFLDNNGFTHLLRAHEVTNAGFSIQQKAKMLTVFSSSNYCNLKNSAACVFVDNGKLRVFRLALE